ncbi:MAG: hypothetical protein LBB87_00430 [Nitrososphaerota archaeon]|jgi:hypothetical protein|nr:hypothetical protein [Nitrososphaerota archaeon]
MRVNAKSTVNFRCLPDKTLFVSLLLVLVLFSSCFISTFSTFSNSVSPFVLGASGSKVSNEVELRSAVNNAKGSTIIELSSDIQLTDTINITTNKDITLTSSKIIGFYKLIGADRRCTLTVEDNGILTIDGIIVTHEGYVEGRGITVESGGKLVLLSGEISGNTAPMSFGGVGGPQGFSGGVYNDGIFEMYGGKISNNRASNGAGGGVGNYNYGIFEMYGGEIFNNTALSITSTNAWGAGGGVTNGGTFVMSGGEIYNNHVDFYGGGVYNSGTFVMSGGKISGNTAGTGGGVYIRLGSFDRQDGVISGNTVTNKDGEGKDVYTYSYNGGSSSSNSGGSSNSNNGSSGGNNGGSGSNSGGLTGGVVSTGGGFSLSEVVVICIGVVGVTLAVVMAVLLFASKRKVVSRGEM